MKKTFLTLLVTGLTFVSFAQEIKNEQRMTLEQRNELQLKKMTIDLDLNEKQQKEIAKVIAEKSQKRELKRAELKTHKETGKKFTAQERFEMKSKMLDEKKDIKSKMQKILNKKQFEKWETKQRENRNKIRGFKKHKRLDAENKQLE